MSNLREPNGPEEERLVDAWNKKNDPTNPDRETHQQMLSMLGDICGQLEAVVNGYFQPPNIMACRGRDWDIFIRRKGSSEEFGEGDWHPGGSGKACQQ